MKKRVVITGIGAVSALGKGVTEMLENMKSQTVNYHTVPEDRFSTDHKMFLNNRGFTMDHEFYKDAWQKDSALMTELADKCIKEAIANANLSSVDIQKEITGLSLGTSVGACFPIIQRMKKMIKEQINDYDLGMYSTPKIIGNIAKKYKLKGPISTISTACASGTNSIGRAFDLIENGRADIMISGGMDIFTELTYTGFNSLFALSKTKCKPFSDTRDGMSLGDACGILILESLDAAIERGAPIYGEVKGYHILNEAYHATAPHPEGKYALKCMQQAMKYGNTSVDEIQYINAHGTGTQKNDGAELKACESLLKDKKSKTFVGSTKCLTGHTLGAAGSIEAIISVLSLKNKEVYANYQANDLPKSEKVDFVTSNKKDIPITNVLSNSFGFGGNMASILLSSYNS